MTFFDHSALFTQLGESTFVLVNDGIYNVREERVVDAEKSAMACPRGGSRRRST